MSLRVALSSFVVFGGFVTACGRPLNVAVPPPVISAQPQSTTVSLCGTVALSVSATGSAPIRYQWMKDDAAIPGAEGPTYTIPRASLADNGSVYRVVVSNAGGSVESQAATLGVTDPGGPTVLVRVVGDAMNVAVNATTVFWAGSTGVGSATLDCTGPARTLYAVGTLYPPGNESPFGIALTQSHVAWTDGNLGVVAAVPIEGGSPTILANDGGPGPYELALAGGRLYWADLRSAVHSVSADGASQPAVFDVGVSGSELDGVAADDTYVYWRDISIGTISRMPLAGGDVAILASAQGSSSGIAADRGFVYWGTTLPGSLGAIVRVSRDGGTPEVIASSSGPPAHLTVDTAHVYWTASGDAAGAGKVYRAPLDGSAPMTILADHLDFPVGITVDDRFVYWAELGSKGGGRVTRLSK